MSPHFYLPKRVLPPSMRHTTRASVRTRRIKGPVGVSGSSVSAPDLRIRDTVPPGDSPATALSGGPWWIYTSRGPGDLFRRLFTGRPKAVFL